MNRNIVNKILIILLMVFLYPEKSSSTTFRELSLKELCERSGDIIVGKVVSLNSYKSPNFSRTYTDIDIEIVEIIKGKLKGNIRLTMFGGTVDGITTMMVGAPSFIPGEQSVFFLSNKPDKKTQNLKYWVTGYFQGKFNIKRDEKTNENMIFRDNFDNPLLLEKDGARLSITNSESMGLSEFIQYINNYVKSVVSG